MTTRDVRLQPGAVFAGVYEVRRLLGQGTMGAVYEVVDTRSGQPGALKLMKRELLADDAKFAERFQQEATICRRIVSDRVVQVLASGADAASGVPWLVMEYLEGVELSAYLEAHATLPTDVARTILDQLFGAVAAAHAAQIVHRDLKPENVFVLGGGAGAINIKVLDFGVAKVVREATLAATAAGLGTPLWTAPEQGIEGQIIKPSADVWALGLITFRLLTGRVFWKSANDKKSSAYDIALELLRGPLPLASERAAELGGAALPPGFDAWFARAVVRDPGARFATARQAHDALEALFAPPRKRTRPWVKGLAVAAVVAVLLAGALGVRWRLHAKHRSHAAPASRSQR